MSFASRIFCCWFSLYGVPSVLCHSLGNDLFLKGHLAVDSKWTTSHQGKLITHKLLSYQPWTGTTSAGVMPAIITPRCRKISFRVHRLAKPSSPTNPNDRELIPGIYLQQQHCCAYSYNTALLCLYLKQQQWCAYTYNNSSIVLTRTPQQCCVYNYNNSSAVFIRTVHQWCAYTYNNSSVVLIRTPQQWCAYTYTTAVLCIYVHHSSGTWVTDSCSMKNLIARMLYCSIYSVDGLVGWNVITANIEHRSPMAERSFIIRTFVWMLNQ